MIMPAWLFMFGLVADSLASRETLWMLSHDVFFTLTDSSPSAVQALIDSCHSYLRDHPGVVFFSVGERTEGLEREVNDRDFHVALHVVFSDRESHDAYQDAPEHHAFIEESSSNWASVRVFDSSVDGGVGRG